MRLRFPERLSAEISEVFPKMRGDYSTAGRRRPVRPGQVVNGQRSTVNRPLSTVHRPVLQLGVSADFHFPCTERQRHGDI